MAIISYLGLTLFPLIVAVIVALAGNRTRKLLIPSSAVVLIVAGLVFVSSKEASTIPLTAMVPYVFGIEIVIILCLLYWGIKLKNLPIAIFNLLQLGGLLYGQFAGGSHPSEASLVVDPLAKILLLLVAIVGSLIILFAVPYMDRYEEKHQVQHSQQGRFFFWIFLFISGMSLLVTADKLAILALGWEITTLCSFMLIGHNQDEQSVRSSIRALEINSFGGLCLNIGILVAELGLGASNISDLLAEQGHNFLFMFVIAMLLVAGLTKSAQMPFQSWLLGAMVAPTPVSALLHSSTMVKAGVYLLIRLAPVYQDTLLGNLLATIGAFTFLMTSAMAISQSNGKRILAYSTIANLGLIVLSAGLGTSLALGAAIFLVIFHAVSKALLFLFVGMVELKLGSKDVEAMHGLVEKMPYLTVAGVIGMVTMFLPPFGMMAGKWAALQAASKMPLVMVMAIFGSALTIVFWMRWAGTIMTTTKAFKDIPKDDYPSLIAGPLAILTFAAIALSISVDFVYRQAVLAGGAIPNTPIDHFMVGPILVVLVLAVVAGLWTVAQTQRDKVSTVYMCGDESVPCRTSNYYMSYWFGEQKLTPAANIVATGLIMIMFGVIA